MSNKTARREKKTVRRTTTLIKEVEVWLNEERRKDGRSFSSEVSWMLLEQKKVNDWIESGVSDGSSPLVQRILAAIELRGRKEVRG